MTVNEQVRCARKYRGLTQTEFAKMIGMDRAYYSRWENDTKNILNFTQSRLELMASVLKISITINPT